VHAATEAHAAAPQHHPASRGLLLLLGAQVLRKQGGNIDTGKITEAFSATTVSSTGPHCCA
jgi:hypothetical protein